MRSMVEGPSEARKVLEPGGSAAAPPPHFVRSPSPA